MSDCQESYEACMAARDARVEAALRDRTENRPWLTDQQVADEAGVSRPTIVRAIARQKLLQNGSPDADCNKEVNSDFINGPLPKLKWRKLYPWSEDRDNEPEIAAVKRAIARCSLDQRAYLWAQVYPVYEPATVERKNDDGTISVRPLI